MNGERAGSLIVSLGEFLPAFGFPSFSLRLSENYIFLFNFPPSLSWALSPRFTLVRTTITHPMIFCLEQQFLFFFYFVHSSFQCSQTLMASLLSTFTLMTWFVHILCKNQYDAKICCCSVSEVFIHRDCLFLWAFFLLQTDPCIWLLRLLPSLVL